MDIEKFPAVIEAEALVSNTQFIPENMEENALVPFSGVSEKERGKASVASARRRGSRIGRPRAEVDVERAVELRAQGMSFRQVAQAMGVGVATVHRALSAQ